MTAGPARRSWHTWRTDGAVTLDSRRTFHHLAHYCGLPETDVVVEQDAAGPTVRFRSTDDDAPSVEALLDRAWRRAAGPADVGVDAAPPRVLVDCWDTPAATHPVRAFRFTGRGLPVGLPPVAVLLRRLDDHLRAMALGDGALEYAVPHLVAETTLDRARYAATFPQHVVSCSVVRPDLDALARVAAAPAWDERVADLVRAPACLTPAACLHLFALLEGDVLAATAAATFVAACARHEAGSPADPRRPASYRVREVVAVGTAADVEAFRARWLERLGALAEALGLPCRVEAANDPFFTDGADARRTFQGALDVKHELVARVDGGDELAVASVNLHQQHFGRGFGIHLVGGEPAHSACVGFGLERLAYWVLGACGEDEARWPAPLRADAAVAAS